MPIPYRGYSTPAYSLVEIRLYHCMLAPGIRMSMEGRRCLRLLGSKAVDPIKIAICGTVRLVPSRHGFVLQVTLSTARSPA